MGFFHGFWWCFLAFDHGNLWDRRIRAYYEHPLVEHPGPGSIHQLRLDGYHLGFSGFWPKVSSQQLRDGGGGGGPSSFPRQVSFDLEFSKMYPQNYPSHSLDHVRPWCSIETTQGFLGIPPLDHLRSPKVFGTILVLKPVTTGDPPTPELCCSRSLPPFGGPSLLSQQPLWMASPWLVERYDDWSWGLGLFQRRQKSSYISH